MQEINILIVDDHPFIIEGYKNAINSYPADGITFKITAAKDCKSGYEAIMNAVDDPFAVALLDFSMPTYTEKGISTGEDLALLIRREMPGCKIALLTMHIELIKISSIVEDIKPNALIIKNDLTFDELLIAFAAVMNNEFYYSPTVKASVKAVKEDYSLEIDSFDKQILFHLGKDTAVAEIPQYVPLLLEAIEQRIQNLSALLGSAPFDNPALLKAARDRKLI